MAVPIRAVTASPGVYVRDPTGDPKRRIPETHYLVDEALQFIVDKSSEPIIVVL